LLQLFVLFVNKYENGSSFFMKIRYLYFCFIFLFAELSAQESRSADSLATAPVILAPTPKQETTPEAPKKRFLRSFLKDDYPNPKKAMLLSFFLPGAGQIYNKKYWKAPIAIGGTIGMAYVIRYNTRGFNFYNDELAAREDESDNLEPDPRLVDWTREDLDRERNRWEKQKELSYIGLIGVQLFTGIDAFVDAHLNGYEINEDLTLKIEPSFEALSGTSMAMGVGVKLVW
jgi:hypothetical protein